ncbi:MAG: hypothetical protein ISN29_11490 [Gammaproteobacteria bacterium AqS3]|nr:hypothetical protein [Gammaproteobacteria bacterium AqS3]
MPDSTSLDGLYQHIGRSLKRHCGLGTKHGPYGLIGKPPKESIDHTVFKIEAYPKKEGLANPEIIPIMRVLHQALASSKEEGVTEEILRSLTINVRNFRNKSGLEITIYSDHLIQWEGRKHP